MSNNRVYGSLDEALLVICPVFSLNEDKTRMESTLNSVRPDQIPVVIEMNLLGVDLRDDRR
ncbi:hypothetical protein ACTXT7_004038 [Hymenolepis weldensis]